MLVFCLGLTLFFPSISVLHLSLTVCGRLVMFVTSYLLKNIMWTLQVMTVFLLLFYIASGIAGKHQTLTGLTEHHIEMSIQQKWSLPMSSVVWHLKTNRKKIKIVEYENNTLTFHHPQFKNRLQLSNNATQLHIRKLRMEDSGNYMCTVTLKNHEMHETSFKLVVYDPVPVPTLITELSKGTSDRYFVTLRCSVPTNLPPVLYMWKYGYKDSDYQLSSNTEDTIQVSLQPESGDMEVICIVHNPADQKNSSVYLHHDGLFNEHSISFKTDMLLYIYISITSIGFMVLIVICRLRALTQVVQNIKNFSQKEKKRKQSDTVV
ncbi:CD48 antigen-like isoform X2 [Pyxicephalus adspersus]|uniref:CD48 antigen-like isoform X2 n=1 Tax=Pyxicephalus adspersus TaxID=30357 RepID=UPI003B59C706